MTPVEVLKEVSRRALDTRLARRALSTRAARRLVRSSDYLYPRVYPAWQRDFWDQIEEYPDWARILGQDPERWAAARERAKSGPSVLIPMSIGEHPFESLLAVALTLRGADVHLLICDRYLPACYFQQIKEFPDTERFARHGPDLMQCADCFSSGHGLMSALGLPIHRNSELITPEERERASSVARETPLEEIEACTVDDVAVGEHAYATALRFYRRGDLEGEPHGEAVLRRYLEAGLLAAYGIGRLISEHDFACVACHHGIYVPHGVYSEVARCRDRRLINWCMSYRKQTTMFSEGDTYHRTGSTEPPENWENMKWTPETEEEILRYLATRRGDGTEDFISFQENTVTDADAIAADLGVDFSKPCIGLLTNVIWDAQVFYPGVAFPGMMEWILATIEYFAGRPELQLIVRIHPAEATSRQRVVEELAEKLGAVPENVFIIPPEKRVNTFSLIRGCDSAIIYGTTMGIELAPLGIPVIVAGEAWVRNKGFTLDASTEEEYFAILDRLPLGERLDADRLEKARKYAYHYFMRRMVPLPLIVADSGWPARLVEVSSLDDLAPGRHPGLDIICDGILEGEKIIYPAERLNGGRDRRTAPRARVGTSLGRSPARP